MTSYTYTQVSGGYRWNMLKRCLWEVGIEPSGLSDYDGQTVLTFSRDLTTAEKTALDTLMAGTPTFPKSGDAVVFKVKDLWGGEDGARWEAFKIACGLPNLKLYYSESVVGSGEVDTIEIHHPTTLTNTQKTTIKNQFAALIS